MALITNIESGFKDRQSIHKRVECTYYIVTGLDEKKYLQLDTYGSEGRQIPGKVSQSIQFSPDAILRLKEILLQEF